MRNGRIIRNNFIPCLFFFLVVIIVPPSRNRFMVHRCFKTLFSNKTQVMQLIQVMKNTFAMSLLGIATSFLPVLFAVFLNEIKCKWFKNLVQTLTTLPNFISLTLVYSRESSAAIHACHCRESLTVLRLRQGSASLC